MKESVVEQYLVKRIRELGGECVKVQFPGRTGAPDRLVLLPKTAIWVETKSPTGVLKAHQRRVHARMQEFGLVVLVLRSIEEVDALFPRPYKGGR